MNNLKSSLPPPLFLLGVEHEVSPPHLHHFSTSLVLFGVGPQK